MDKRDALLAVIADPNRPETEKRIARAALATLAPKEPHRQISEDAKAMLARFHKKHLAEITEQEWDAYRSENLITGRSPLTQEFREWVPWDADALELLGMSLLDWWKRVLKRATGEDVKVNALARIAELEAQA